MRDGYKVVSEYRLGNKVALFLDRNRPYNQYETMFFHLDGDCYPYELAHAENVITTESTQSFLGKTIYFE